MSFQTLSLEQNPKELFIFNGNNILLNKNKAPVSLSFLKELMSSSYISDSFTDSSISASGIILRQNDSLEQIPLFSEFEQIPLRQYFYDYPEQSGKAARILALGNWRKYKQYCSACGTKLVNNSKLTALDCPSCKDTFFPRIEPCIIILITKGDQILLANHKQRNQELFTCLAGFMECGENIEECAKREVMEEVGLEIENIRYCASQSWPYPDQLMIGLRAEYKSGTIKLQEEELLQASWFDWDNLPSKTPQKGSLAYRLIHKEFD